MLRLPKVRIIKKRPDFQHVYHAGRSMACRYFVLYVMETEEHAGKVGFAAGKKLGCAVVRNRVKRLLRECYRLHQEELREGVAILLVGRKAMTTAKRDVVERAYLALGRKMGIFS